MTKGNALKWFDSNKRTMGGIYAGEYIDRQDFEEFIQSLPIPSPGDNQSLEESFSTYMKLQGKLSAWNLAITIANNECMRMSDDWNNDDQTEEAHAANECAKRIRGYIDNPVPELGTIASRPSIDIVDELRKANPYEYQPMGDNEGFVGWNKCCYAIDPLLNQKEAK